MNRRQRILNHYQTRVKDDREWYDILDWGSRQAQIMRFQALAGVLGDKRYQVGSKDGKKPALLDIGCGFGELASFLENRNIFVDYTGIDICTAFVEAAKNHNPTLNLIVGDAFFQPPLKSGIFDLVFASGTLNLQVEEHDKFVTMALARMVDLSRSLVAVNFLHVRTVDKYEHCRYYKPDDIEQMLPARAVVIDVIDEYLENDFTVLIKV